MNRILLLLTLCGLLLFCTGCHATGTVIYDNHTPFFIDVYVDDFYEGTVGPYGVLYVEVDTGWRRLEAQDEFGFWYGPVWIDLHEDEQYTYHLY